MIKTTNGFVGKTCFGHFEIKMIENTIYINGLTSLLNHMMGESVRTGEDFSIRLAKGRYSMFIVVRSNLTVDVRFNIGDLGVCIETLEEQSAIYAGHHIKQHAEDLLDFLTEKSNTLAIRNLKRWEGDSGTNPVSIDTVVHENSIDGNSTSIVLKISGKVVWEHSLTQFDNLLEMIWWKKWKIS